jgi:hypothetical protein
MVNLCRFGRHKWGDPTKDGIRVCKTCEERSYPKPPPKPARCELGTHSFKNKNRGKLNTCENCGGQYYVKTWKEELKEGE